MPPADGPARPSSPEAAPVLLRVVDDKGFERTILIESSLFRVGRDKGNSLCIDHPSVAGCHFLIVREGSRHTLTDTSQGHGTRLNGSPVAQRELRDGDEISIGDAPYRVFFRTSGSRDADRERKRLRALLEASKAINSSLVLDEVLDRVMDCVMEITGAAKGFVMLVEPDGSLRTGAVRNIDAAELDREVIPASRSVIQGTIHSGRSAFLGSGLDGVSDPTASIVRLSLQSIMCVPILLNERVAGVIYVDHTSPLRNVSRADLEILESLADHASVAIGNAELSQRMLLAERLSAVGRMVSSIVHDFRGPITAIRGSAQILRLKPDDPRRAEQLRLIEDEVERMTQMTREVLDFCRGQMTLTTRRCRLSEFLPPLLDKMRHEMAVRRAELHLDLEADGTLRLDPERLERVFRNLLDNAADAMPEGGRITVRSVQEGETSVISVTDTGCGMSEEVRRRLFEPFFTDGKTRGNGLGMAIVQQIVEAHGWSIEIDTAPGEGTTVRIVTSRPAAKAIAAEACSGAAAG